MATTGQVTLELEATREMVRAAKAQGLSLTGPDGLLKALTMTVVEVSLEEEMTDHLGYPKHEVTGRDSGNSRNGTRTKTVITDNAGPVEIVIPRDRNGTFEPQIVAKHQRRLNGVDEIVLSLTAKGLTTGEISAHPVLPPRPRPPPNWGQLRPGGPIQIDTARWGDSVSRTGEIQLSAVTVSGLPSRGISPFHIAPTPPPATAKAGHTTPHARQATAPSAHAAGPRIRERTRGSPPP